MRALVVEDEVKMAALIRRGLVEEGYAADVARTGEEAGEAPLDDRDAGRIGARTMRANAYGERARGVGVRPTAHLAGAPAPLCR